MGGQAGDELQRPADEGGAWPSRGRAPGAVAEVYVVGTGVTLGWEVDRIGS